MIFALVVGASLLVALELIRRERGHYLESKRSAAVMLTELFAAAVGPAVDFGDPVAVAHTLGMLSQNREVSHAAVWQGTEPRAVSQIGSPRPGERRPTCGSCVLVFDNQLTIVRPVSDPLGKHLGTVGVTVSLARENAAFASARRRIFWMTSGLAALVALLLMGAVRRSIISPLAQLEASARRLARGELVEVDGLRRDEVGNLGQAFNDMGRVIREREESIVAMNARIQNLLDHMRQAILVFDAAGQLARERSRLAHQVFGDVRGTDTNIADLLYPSAQATSVEREAFLSWLREVEGTDPSEFDELVELAPKEITLAGVPDGCSKTLELEFRQITEQAGNRRFMLLATDITSQRRLERTAEAQERAHARQLNAMRRLVAGGGQDFMRFLRAARERIAEAQQVDSQFDRLTSDGVEKLFRLVHTLRAEARSFDLRAVEALASTLELDLAGARHTASDSLMRESTKEKMSQGLAQLSSALNEAEDLFVASSPIGRRILDQVTVLRSDVDQLLEHYGRTDGQLGTLVSRLASRPFGELSWGLIEAVERWAGDDGKRVQIQVLGRDVQVPFPLCQHLGGVLSHLLRNAIAHGIEVPAERLQHGKPDVGQIEVLCTELAQGIRIEVRDDGAGFDIPALELHAKAQGLDARGFELAFEAGVTTRPQADALAGLGVGLGAVREDLDSLGYRISISSRPHLGSHICIEPVKPTLRT
jgi:two-component system, chemotaxis family, sensor kinase CheA